MPTPGREQLGAARGSFLQARCDSVMFTGDWCLPLVLALLVLLLIYTFLYLPRVDDVVRFPGLPPRRQLTYQAKQTISREMEQEKMRRAEQLMLQRNPCRAQTGGKKADGPRPIRNHHQRLETIVKQTTPEVDFFGRVLAPKPPRPPPTSETGEKCPSTCMGKAVGDSDVWFRFNEGMSNAVRRNVYIRELL
ncbi:hypothetical protein KUCAC02_016325 [Chaenocephalus aceratus]|uniref:Uncharacterized protein n=1 Tax=Chaenocephalus aceratus TaxID=36190 RepID=A0ACB9Y002_CHAAC|nr:hypothetical protein KUCAC02_016325 [Chaenocephalus aceratus]